MIGLFLDREKPVSESSICYESFSGEKIEKIQDTSEFSDRIIQEIEPESGDKK